MKQFIFLLAGVLLMATAGFSQASFQTMGGLRPNGTVVTRDTLTNADTTYLTARFTGSYDLVFEITNTKVSGTVAGNIILQGSTDNSTWLTMKTNTAYAVGVSDTATLANATGTYHWLVPDHPFNYYRVRVITSGTQVSAPTGRVYYRKPE